MLVSLIVSSEVILMIDSLSLFFNIDNNMAPTAPNDAASDGVATPKIIEPNTIIIKKIGAIRDLTIFTSDIEVFFL
jgi:hypothetical protein